MGKVWSKERAWEWYNNHNWLRGCNFMSSDCANRIDQWQEEGFEERLKTADEELALAAETGFNSIRIILEFFVWDQQHDGFMERFDRYLETAWKHGISCMVVDANDIDVEILGKSPDLADKPAALLADLIRDNPAGQDDELTPFVIVRDIGC